jgi:hypothetical protein
VKSQPPNGELATVLEKMLDAGQIEWAPLRQGSREVVIGAHVTPDEIRELLPLARHPLAQALVRCFLERHIVVPQLTGTEHKLPFEGMPDVDFFEFPSGVPNPPGLDESAKQWAAELEAVEYLGAPLLLTPNGWVDLYVVGWSVEIRCVSEGDALLSYPTIEDFKKDIVIVALPKSPDDPVGLLGWVDRKRFLRLRRIACCGDTHSCVFNLTDLLPMAVLNDSARKKRFS